MRFNCSCLPDNWKLIDLHKPWRCTSCFGPWWPGTWYVGWSEGIQKRRVGQNKIIRRVYSIWESLRAPCCHSRFRWFWMQKNINNRWSYKISFNKRLRFKWAGDSNNDSQSTNRWLPHSCFWWSIWSFFECRVRLISFFLFSRAGRLNRTGSLSCCLEASKWVHVCACKLRQYNSARGGTFKWIREMNYLKHKPNHIRSYGHFLHHRHHLGQQRLRHLHRHRRPRLHYHRLVEGHLLARSAPLLRNLFWFIASRWISFRQLLRHLRRSRSFGLFSASPLTSQLLPPPFSCASGPLSYRCLVRTLSSQYSYTSQRR